MKRHVSLLTTILFASATMLMAQAPTSPAPRTKPEQTPATTPDRTTTKPDQTSAPKTATHDNTASTKTTAGPDREFVRNTASGGQAEVELAMLAEQKASSNDVKMLASRIQTDHMKANEELKTIASQKGWDLPTEPNSDQKYTKSKFEKLSGDEFDKAFTAQMVKSHSMGIAAFQHEASAGTDKDVKQFARKTLPTLKEHLAMAQKTQKAIGGADTSSYSSQQSKSGTKPSDRKQGLGTSPTTQKPQPNTQKPESTPPQPETQQPTR
jgi:putative membrane protein